MYSQEIYIFFYDILSLALIWRLGQVLPVWLDVCPTGAFQDSPESLKVPHGVDQVRVHLYLETYMTRGKGLAVKNC